MNSGERAALERSLVRVCTTLRAADVPFAVTGGTGVYARGGPFSEHDVDVLVRPADADKAVRALVSVGMRATDAPEDWLRKKLLSLGAHHCDFGWILPAARALREQIDWVALRARTEHHPYAEAFLLLAERLSIPPGQCRREDSKDAGQPVGREKLW